MTIDKVAKVISNFFREPIDIDGFIYEFVKIGTSREYVDALSFLINVKLPDPEQSYCVEVFEERVKRLIYDSFQYLGENYSYAMEITIDGKELFENTYMYVRPEQMDIMIQDIREDFSELTIKTSKLNIGNNLNFKILYKWANKPYDVDNNEMNFYLDLKLYDLNVDGKVVTPNPEKLNLLAGAITQEMYDMDTYQVRMTDIPYDVLESEIKVKDLDIYYNISFVVKNIDGLPVKSQWSSFFEDDFFK